MALEWQPVTVPLGSTQDESQSRLKLPNPLLAQLQNARVYKTGAVGKRPGWGAKAALTTYERAIAVDDELFTIQQRTIATGAPVRLGAVNASLNRVDYQQGAQGSYSLSEVEVLERQTMIRDVLSGDGTGSVSSSLPDFAVSANTGIAVIAWEVGVPATLGPAQHVIMAMPVDVSTRQPLAPPRQLSTGNGDNDRPHVVLDTATSIVVVYARAANNEIRAISFDCTTRTWGADTVLVNNLNNVQVKFDVCEIVGSTGYMVAFKNTTPIVQLNKCTGVASVAVATLGEDANSLASGIAVYADNASDNVWLAWYDTVNGLRAAIRRVSNVVTVVLANTTMEVATDSARQVTFAPALVTTTMILCWTTNANTTLPAYGRKQTKFRTLTSGGAKGTQFQVADVELLSKAFTCSNGFTYAAVIYDGSDVDPTVVPGQRSFSKQVAFTMCICDTTDAANGNHFTSFRCAATWAQGEAGRKRLHSSLSAFREVLVDGLNEHWWMLAPEFDTVLASSGVFDANQIVGRPGVDLCRQRIGNVPPIFAARIGQNVVFSGGVPQVWDGSNLNEYGFLVPPENGKSVAVAGGGSLSAGLYGAQLVFEYRLSTGDLTQSAPALVRSTPTATSVTVAALNDHITITAPSLSLTRKWNEASSAEGVVVRAFRTEANQTIYYAEGDFQVLSGFAASFPVGVALTIPVTQADATVITHRPIYTNGDILENFAPPALSYVFTHRNRLFGISAENRRRVVFTHTYDIGELPGWHPDLVIDVPDDAVALATLDEKLIILCKNGIYLIAGDGPDRKGLNSDYQAPFRLNSPHGCLTAESVVSFPNGIVFQAPTGFCLMDRQTTVTRIGGPVEDTVASYPYAHAAVVIPESEWIYWAMTDSKVLGSSTAGRTICYDWRGNVWSVDVVGFPGEFGAGFTFHTSLARTKAGVFSTIQANPALYRQEGQQDPGAQWIYTKLVTAMLHLGSNQLFQRARWLTLLGEKLGIHGLVVTVDTFTHATSAPQTQQFVWDDATLAVMPDYALKMHLANQKGAFFRVTVADGPDVSFPALADDSASFVSLMLEMGLKKARPQMAQGATK